MWELVRGNKNLSIPWYLMTSYLYYEMDRAIIPDSDYDELCKFIQSNWDDIQHFHKHLVDPEYLNAGTGFALQYNSRIAGAAIMLLSGPKEVYKWMSYPAIETEPDELEFE